ncbi:MAG: hypothetical protein GY928_08810 [Colwellia sp.]|nr:hypothetical protein [Colwellia sp.]
MQIPFNNTNLNIHNIYIPPTPSYNNNPNKPTINHLLSNTDESLIVGDFNAHHHLWFSP